jgi:hypothetical protein
MVHHLRSRLARLEALHRPVCPQCFDVPVRIVVTDEHDHLVSETFGPAGCPGCGREVSHSIRVECEPDAPEVWR